MSAVGQASAGATGAATPAGASQLLQRLHGLCSSHADCVPPHGRFHLRQLMNKLEAQVRPNQSFSKYIRHHLIQPNFTET